MLVQAFPHDRQLPALAPLVTGPPPEVEAALLARFGPGEWRAEAWKVEAVRYRVDQRATLRLTAWAREAASGRTEEKRFYAKVYNRDDRGEQAHRVLEELWAKAGAGGTGFAVGRPIAYLNGLRTLLQEEVPGTILRKILHKEKAIPAARRAARALAALHLSDVVAPQHRRLQDELARSQRAGKCLRSACPHLGPRIEEVIGAVVAGLEAVPSAPIHGDLKPAHVLFDGDSVALIDLDKFAMADPLLDVTQLLFDLVKMPPPRSRLPQGDERPPDLARVFIEEYFAHVPEDWRARLPVHYTDAVLKKAAGSLRRQTPGWSEKAEAHLKEAEDSLAGRLW